MAYELEPRPIRPRRRPALTAAAIAVAAVAVVAAARLGQDPGSPTADPSPRAVAVASTEGGPATAGPWRLAGPDPTLPPPGHVECRDVPRLRCADALTAARNVVVALGARPVAAIVHSSLVCGSHRDCPRSLIADAEPLGSVVIRFDDRRETWVNVVRRRADRAGTVAQPEARVVHWTTWSP